METVCAEKPFRKFDCEEEQKNVSITGEVYRVKGELTHFFFFLRCEITELFWSHGTISEWERRQGEVRKRWPLKATGEWDAKQKQRLIGPQ